MSHLIYCTHSDAGNDLALSCADLRYNKVDGAHQYTIQPPASSLASLADGYTCTSDIMEGKEQEVFVVVAS